MALSYRNMAFLQTIPLLSRPTRLRSWNSACSQHVRNRNSTSRPTVRCMSEIPASSKVPDTVSVGPSPMYKPSNDNKLTGSKRAGPDGSGNDPDANVDAGAVGRGMLVGFSAALMAALVQHDWLEAHRDIVLVAIFLAGYGSIVLEASLDINKAAPALLMSAGIWTTLLVAAPDSARVFEALNGSVLEVGQILLFLAGAMSTVEIMDGHDAFRIVTDRLPRASKRQLLWAIGISTFALSSVLDDLTTTIVMLSLLRKIIPADQKEDRLLFGGAVVIAA